MDTPRTKAAEIKGSNSSCSYREEAAKAWQWARELERELNAHCDAMDKVLSHIPHRAEDMMEMAKLRRPI